MLAECAPVSRQTVSWNFVFAAASAAGTVWQTDRFDQRRGPHVSWMAETGDQREPAAPSACLGHRTGVFWIALPADSPAQSQSHVSLLKYFPKSPLSAFVKLFWHYDGYAQQHAWERVLPTGGVQLVIRLRNDPLRTFEAHHAGQSQDCHGPLMCGPHSRFFAIDTTPLAACMGVLFEPGGAYPFLDGPASELHNLNAPLDALWGSAAQELRDRLLEAKTPDSRFEILEQSLLSHVYAPLERHPAVAFALRAFHAVPQVRTIAEVAKKTGLSQKWFIESFRAQVGLTPKMYCRLRRFQTALTLMGRHEGVDFAGLAHACGYCDQAHFIRDFREFSDVCPTDYLADRTEHKKHARLADLLYFCPIFGVRLTGELGSNETI